VTTVADTKSYADILGVIPALSTCTPEVLDEFVATCDCTVRPGGGAEFRSPTDADGSLYVVLSGSVVLATDDGVRIVLEPGDYFGGTAAQRHQHLIASAVADADAEILVIGPAQVLQLRHASTRHNHPSNIDWSPAPLSPSATFVPRRRRLVLVSDSPS
jgi:hypothetical protein